ncbi:putative secondary metabolism biosynthetic enzyme [Cytospora paraplurivora]|uniref:Secondary metabolism biosynthetic enzyme n=1 Tax=Cytospora paraplurivora TaxID=2898453 RepID=A0AAN9UKT9_9PEZI
MDMSKPKVPRLHRALVATGPSVLDLKSVAVPRIAPDEVLVRTMAVALNPSDYKFLDQSTALGAVLGADFSGIVVRLGGNVHGILDIGDRVLGPAFGANPSNPGNGAFAQYVTVPARLCVRLPDAVDFAAGASLPTAIYTVGFVFRSLGIELHVNEALGSSTTPPTIRGQDDGEGQQSSRGFVLVHGGATATGTVALQLLRAAGYTPLATCSPSNFALVYNRGAAAAFNYASPTVRDEIRDFTHGKLSLALDCIGNPASMVLCYGAIGDGGGRYATLEPYPARLAARRRDISPDWILAWTLFAKELRLPEPYYRPSIPEDREFGEAWAGSMQRLLEAGLLRPHPLNIYKTGLSAVIPGLDLLRKHQVRGKKLVVMV